MKKWMIAVGVVAVIGLYVMSSYNAFVPLEEDVNAKWSQVLNVYQRRADLIPNLVNVVKGYAAHEKDTLVGVTEARAKATQISPDAMKNITNDPQAFNNFQQAQSGLSSALSKLMVVVEKYPELKANENFKQLQDQLEGTENRITVERQRFNESAQTFNVKVRGFPSNVLANLFGFHTKIYFTASEGAEKAPVVNF